MCAPGAFIVARFAYHRIVDRETESLVAALVLGRDLQAAPDERVS